MKCRKILPILLVLLIVGVYTSQASAHQMAPAQDIEEIILDYTSSGQNSDIPNENETEISIFGPLGRLLHVAEVKLIDGPFVKMKLIWFLLNSRNIQLFLPFLTVKVKDLAFSVRYTKNIPQLPLIRKFSYNTVIKENNNETHYNLKHTVIVTGFDGVFSIFRAKPFRFTPAYFWFSGSYDDIIILE